MSSRVLRRTRKGAVAAAAEADDESDDEMAAAEADDENGDELPAAPEGIGERIFRSGLSDDTILARDLHTFDLPPNSTEIRITEP